MHLMRCWVFFLSRAFFTAWSWLHWSLRKTTTPTSTWILSSRRQIYELRTTTSSRPTDTRYVTLLACRHKFRYRGLTVEYIQWTSNYYFYFSKSRCRPNLHNTTGPSSRAVPWQITLRRRGMLQTTTTDASKHH